MTHAQLADGFASLKEDDSNVGQSSTDPLPLYTDGALPATARWSIDGDAVYITFDALAIGGLNLLDSNGDSLPDKVDWTRPWNDARNCSDFFDDNTSALLGDMPDTACEWFKNNTLEVRPGNVAVSRGLAIGDDITFRSYTVYSFYQSLGSWAFAPESTYQVELPVETLIAPSVAVYTDLGVDLVRETHLAQFPMCKGLRLTALADLYHGGVPQYSWSLLEVTCTYTDANEDTYGYAANGTGTSKLQSRLRSSSVGGSSTARQIEECAMQRACAQGENVLDLAIDDLECGCSYRMSLRVGGRWGVSTTVSFSFAMEVPYLPYAGWTPTCDYYCNAATCEYPSQCIEGKCVCVKDRYGPFCRGECNCAGYRSTGCDDGQQGSGRCYCLPGLYGYYCDMYLEWRGFEWSPCLPCQFENAFENASQTQILKCVLVGTSNVVEDEYCTEKPQAPVQQCMPPRCACSWPPSGIGHAFEHLNLDYNATMMMCNNTPSGQSCSATCLPEHYSLGEFRCHAGNFVEVPICAPAGATITTLFGVYVGLTIQSQLTVSTQANAYLEEVKPALQMGFAAALHSLAFSPGDFTFHLNTRETEESTHSVVGNSRRLLSSLTAEVSAMIAVRSGDASDFDVIKSELVDAATSFKLMQAVNLEYAHTCKPPCPAGSILNLKVSPPQRTQIYVPESSSVSTTASFLQSTSPPDERIEPWAMRYWWIILAISVVVCCMSCVVCLLISRCCRRRRLKSAVDLVPLQFDETTADVSFKEPATMSSDITDMNKQDAYTASWDGLPSRLLAQSNSWEAFSSPRLRQSASWGTAGTASWEVIARSSDELIFPHALPTSPPTSPPESEPPPAAPVITFWPLEHPLNPLSMQKLTTKDDETFSVQLSDGSRPVSAVLRRPSLVSVQSSDSVHRVSTMLRRPSIDQRTDRPQSAPQLNRSFDKGISSQSRIPSKQSSSSTITQERTFAQRRGLSQEVDVRLEEPLRVTRPRSAEVPHTQVHEARESHGCRPHSATAVTRSQSRIPSKQSSSSTVTQERSFAQRIGVRLEEPRRVTRPRSAEVPHTQVHEARESHGCRPHSATAVTRSKSADTQNGEFQASHVIQACSSIDGTSRHRRFSYTSAENHRPQECGEHNVTRPHSMTDDVLRCRRIRSADMHRSCIQEAMLIHSQRPRSAGPLQDRRHDELFGRSDEYHEFHNSDRRYVLAQVGIGNDGDDVDDDIVHQIDSENEERCRSRSQERLKYWYIDQGKQQISRPSSAEHVRDHHTCESPQVPSRPQSASRIGRWQGRPMEGQEVQAKVSNRPQSASAVLSHSQHTENQAGHRQVPTRPQSACRLGNQQGHHSEGHEARPKVPERPQSASAVLSPHSRRTESQDGCHQMPNRPQSASGVGHHFGHRIEDKEENQQLSKRPRSASISNSTALGIVQQLWCPACGVQVCQQLQQCSNCGMHVQHARCKEEPGHAPKRPQSAGSIRHKHGHEGATRPQSAGKSEGFSHFQNQSEDVASFDKPCAVTRRRSGSYLQHAQQPGKVCSSQPGMSPRHSLRHSHSQARSSSRSSITMRNRPSSAGTNRPSSAGTNRPSSASRGRQ